jgi:hypothetical protein
MIHWKSVKAKYSDALLAETASTDRCEATVILKIVPTFPRPYLVIVEISCDGHKVKRTEKTFIPLPPAVRYYEAAKQSAAEKLQTTP